MRVSLLSTVLVVAAVSGCVSSPSNSRDANPVARLMVTDMDGTAHDLGAEMKAGRSVALVFWQTWCASCLQEAPALAAAARKHGKAIRFIGVVPGPNDRVDDKKVRAVARRFAMPYPQVRDRDLALSDRFAVTGTPTIIVLGPDGKIVYNGHEPPADWQGLHK